MSMPSWGVYRNRSGLGAVAEKLVHSNPPFAFHRARSGEWPAWFPFLVFWALAGACRRHGVGGFIGQFTIISTFIETEHLGI